jgi:class 3 adenylate cyclase/predicted ATPase
MDVGGWLRGLGLGQYAETFRDNKIDADLLPRLTVDDLKDIGVSVVGHRRRLLDAIALIAGADRPAEVPVSPSKSAPSKGLEASAERRPITVMFCDLVGSTSIAAKLDAEDWRTLVNTYLDEASAAVTGLGGHVLKKLGDGLMALFGYPHAQENDAERAVRAALAIQRALVEINARNARRGAPELSARIGLDSGQVVVDATGEVFGDAPNIAARVQGAAEPGSILITATVQRQTVGLFVAEDRGQHELKGLSAPMTLYRVVRASGGGRRGGARALTPLVGRKEELDLLSRRWERARRGEGQLALIVGEPGLGKSRLMDEFHGRLGETPHTWVEWSSSQLLQNTPLHPIAEWGRQRFGADLPAEQRLADLENTLGLIGLDPTEYTPLLAPLVDVLLPEDRAAKLAPEELRRRQLAAMTAWILAAAKTQAIVLAFEDLHWADPTSLDLMRALAERGAQAPLLIIATARPEFRPPWSVRSHHSVISLSPLDSVQIAKMVAELSAHHALPRDIVEGVSERTGGVPLFVEEVTRLLLERGERGGAQAIPPTLQQSLAARLDRLGSARETAQIGAVLGRGFSYALLAAVAAAVDRRQTALSGRGYSDPALQSALERLTGADILFVEGDGAQATYRFKHALIQDAAYDSLLKSRRQTLHAQAAEILRESASPEPEAIAHHFTQAGLDDLAIEWWGKAGDQALRRSAFQEAIAHLGKAIAMADKGAAGMAAGASGERRQLHVAYGNALIAARGYGAPETTEAFAKARESAGGHKDAPERLAADYGLWVGSFVRGELSPMRARAETFLSDVEARPDSPEAGVAHRAAGITCWVAGEYREARDHLERALALFQPGRDNDLAFRFGQDPGVAAMLYLALVLWPLGDVERAGSLVRDAVARSAALTHIGARAYGSMHAAIFELMRGDLTRFATHAAELAQLAREHDLPLWRAWGVFLEGAAKAKCGEVGGGLADMRRGVELLREQSTPVNDALVKIALAEAEARAGDVDRALAILDEALATSERISHRTFDAELHRVRGEMRLKRDPPNPASAEEALQTAIAVAKRQATRSFELRAALALAKLYQTTARPAEAHAVLASALEGFAPTPEMPEIAAGQAWLAALEEMDEVTAEVARRRRKTRLHAAYGNAMILAHGYGARETSAAFERARDTATAQDGFERLSAQYGLWAGSFVRGELGAMRELSAAMLRDCERRPQSGEASIAHRMRGVTHWCAGEFAASRGHLEQATAIFDPERDGDLAFRFGQDPGIVATAYLAEVLWLLGEVALADQRMTETTARAAKSGHAATSAYGFFMATHFELIRRNPDRAATFARSLIKIADEHQLPFWMAHSAWLDGWLEWRSGDRKPGVAAMRNSLARQAEQGSVTTFFETLLAEAEAEAGESDVAFCTINHALAASERTGLHWYDAETHRIRGEILLKQAPSVPAPPEEAFLTAIAIAQRQKARSFELRAALALAKLHRATDRDADAHPVLAPALEGFTPTPEMPEIAEARALLVAIEAGAHVRRE